AYLPAPYPSQPSLSRNCAVQVQHRSRYNRHVHKILYSSWCVFGPTKRLGSQSFRGLALRGNVLSGQNPQPTYRRFDNVDCSSLRNSMEWPTAFIGFRICQMAHGLLRDGQLRTPTLHFMRIRVRSL
ncbi:uncharacterized protein CCOS01_08962, partial [Colletotrichum costaricense]